MGYTSKHTGSEIDAGIDAAYEALPASGGTMTGELILHGSPSKKLGAATKEYVDNAINGIENNPGGNGSDDLSKYPFYSEENPPPYPVTSVNGETGDVIVPTGAGVDFSTSETDTGLKWIDGRPVYTRMFVVENPGTATGLLDIGMVTDLVWLDMSGCFLKNDGAIFHAAHIGATGTRTLVLQIGVSNTDNAAILYATPYGTSTIYVKAFYVKAA